MHESLVHYCRITSCDRKKKKKNAAVHTVTQQFTGLHLYWSRVLEPPLLQLQQQQPAANTIDVMGEKTMASNQLQKKRKKRKKQKLHEHNHATSTSDCHHQPDQLTNHPTNHLTNQPAKQPNIPKSKLQDPQTTTSQPTHQPINSRIKSNIQ